MSASKSDSYRKTYVATSFDATIAKIAGCVVNCWSSLCLSRGSPCRFGGCRIPFTVTTVNSVDNHTTRFLDVDECMEGVVLFNAGVSEAGSTKIII